MKPINLTNAGLLLGAIAAFYIIGKSVKWNSAMNTLGGHDANIANGIKQYAPQWSDSYDWMQGVEKNGRVTYA